jgi:hypothetical protein
MMTQLDLNLTVVCSQLNQWGCPDWLSRLILDYRSYDKRKWRLVLRLSRGRRLTKSAVEKLVKRPPLPMTRKAQISEKVKEVCYHYEMLSSSCHVMACTDSDTAWEKYSHDLIAVKNDTQLFEKACFELMTLDPEKNVLLMLKSTFPYLFNDESSV